MGCKECLLLITESFIKLDIACAFPSELFFLFTNLIRLVNGSALNSRSGGLDYPDSSLLLKLNESIVVVFWEMSLPGYAFMR